MNMEMDIHKSCLIEYIEINSLLYWEARHASISYGDSRVAWENKNYKLAIKKLTKMEKQVHGNTYNQEFAIQIEQLKQKLNKAQFPYCR